MPELRINARELYGFIEPPQTFMSWIRDSAVSFGYEMGEDWMPTSHAPGAPEYMIGRPQVMLSARFANKLHDEEKRRRDEMSRRRPVVEKVFKSLS